jgi:hypothetical protein
MNGFNPNKRGRRKINHPRWRSADHNPAYPYSFAEASKAIIYVRKLKKSCHYARVSSRFNLKVAGMEDK